MITYVYDDLFTSPASVLVNTVNTVGVMGKGLAKEFKRLLPEMFRAYQARCESGELRIGTLFLYRTANKSVLNFPTKKHWRSPSRVEYIEEGLKTFVASYEKWAIDSVAFPQLGCGNGELEWESQVKPLMEHHLKGLPIRVYIHVANSQTGTPEHRDQKWMKRWLNSEPESLPAHEVWADLIESIEADPVIEGWNAGVVAKQVVSSWSDDYEDAGNLVQAITFSQGQESVAIHEETFLPVWRQLTTYGLISKDDLPPSIQVSNAPLLQLLQRLDYIQPTRFATSKVPELGLVEGVMLVPRPATTAQQLQLLPVS
jgi:O-acetyl-ADP-ribose deacetylase (regulator of RNase III)